MSIIIVILTIINTTGAYNILGIFLFPAKSHYVAVLEPILTELVHRGHRLTVYSSFNRLYDEENNYEHVDVGRCFNMSERRLTAEHLRSVSDGGTYKALKAVLDIAPDYRKIRDCQPLVRLLRNDSSSKFDLILTEMFNSEISLLFPYALNAPFVAVECTDFFFWRYSAYLANPNWHQPIATENYDVWLPSGFFERLRNLYATLLVADLTYDRLSTEKSDEAGRRLLGPDTPSVKEIAKNTSLMLVYLNSGPINPRPLSPSVIDISGVNIKPVRQLPINIERFMNESEHGIIYFSMGSLIQGASFPEYKRNAFIRAFSKIPQRILWKWESDRPLTSEASNIMTAKWMPQRDILAHPKVKLFISHGGTMGINEALYEGVPILGIPIFGDQRSNLKTVENAGSAEILNYEQIDEQLVLRKIRKLLNEPRYRRNAKILSEKFRDRPLSALDTAVYWIEYVIRHKGAAHLRSVAVELPWYQYLLLDVIAFCIFLSTITLISIYYLLKFISQIAIRKFNRKLKSI